jgi:chitin disaccharide deacetylase
MKTLVINADDFGLSRGVNSGIAQAHERGIVTSASLMVRWPAAAEAAEWARAHPSLGVGLHFDIGEWACSNGEWRILYQVISPRDCDAVAGELERQLDTFRLLMGCEPTHLDSHQHVHRRSGVREPVLEAAKKLAIPLRHFCPQIRYCGDFYGQTGNGVRIPGAITVESLLSIFSRLPVGVTELACHPAAAVDFDSMYLEERVSELATLSDTRAKMALAGGRVNLRSFEGIEVEHSNPFADQS